MKEALDNLDEDQVFSALADQNRRKLIELLHQKDSTLLELSEFFPFSFQALSKHIKVLEKAQIIQKRKEGKYRVLSLNRESLKPTLKWVSYYSNFWHESFDQLEDMISEKQQDGDQ